MAVGTRSCRGVLGAIAEGRRPTAAHTRQRPAEGPRPWAGHAGWGTVRSVGLGRHRIGDWVNLSLRK